MTGFTLLEVVVTLFLIGLAAALVAPALRTDAGPRDEFAAVVAQSRELAVRRAQTLFLQVDAQGRWKLTPAGDRNSIGGGSIAGGVTQKLRITPLGSCFAEDSPINRWDVIACARVSEGDTR